jgi:beta-lactamase regulating signal transducer with metallopeptidase domain
MLIQGDFIHKKIFLVVLLAILLAFFVILIVPKKAQMVGTIEGLDQTASKAYLGDQADINQDSKIIQSIPETIGQVVGAILAFVGVLFFLLMIYGGVTWMTAQGNDQKVTKAKSVIEAAAIGIVIVLAAYAITAYVGRALTG